MPKFSVIVPAYKVEQYLPKCIDSILDQSFDDFEVILVDDGSPDRVPLICDAYREKDSRVKVIHKQNGGLVSARRAGCAVAQGDYILNVDGDDWVVHNYFECLNDIIQEHHPDCICFGAFYVSEKQSVPRSLVMDEGVYEREDIVSKIFPSLIEDPNGRYFSPSVWSKAIKRELYVPQQLAVDPKIKIGEDHACVKPILYRCQKIYITKAILYCYRLNATSMTKERKPFSWDGPELIGRHFEKQLPMDRFDFQNHVYRNITHNLFNVAVSQFYRSDRYRSICKDITTQLNRSYYRNALKHCKYRSITGIGVRCVLRFRIYWLLKLKAKHSAKF